MDFDQTKTVPKNTDSDKPGPLLKPPPLFIDTQPREKIDVVLRWQVLRRDGFRCVACGESAIEGAVLEIDHKIPVSQGGRNLAENLHTLCQRCNRGKCSQVVEEFLDDEWIEAYRNTPEWEAVSAFVAHANRILQEIYPHEDITGCVDYHALKAFSQGLPVHLAAQVLRRAMLRCPPDLTQIGKFFAKACWSELRRREGRP